MKNIFFLILGLSNFLFSQSLSKEPKSFLELKEDIKASIIAGETLTQTPFILNNEFNKVNVPEKKKAGLAILYSLLLPGMGELYAESYSSGKYFTIAEGALWGTFIGMNVYASWMQNRYKSFAASNAGINPDGKDDEYFSIISEYLSIEEYNNEKALERKFGEMYNTKRFYWNWQNSDDRKKYRSMWVSSEQTFNDVRFVAGLLIVNRLVSAINAVRLVSAYNKRIEEEVSWNIYMGLSNPINLPTSVTLNFQTKF
jgi:hypothetical protein